MGWITPRWRGIPTLATQSQSNQAQLRNLLLTLRLRTAILIIVLLVAGDSGCIFSPKKDTTRPPVTPPPVYFAPDIPQNTLQNLVTAYENRDSVRCKAVYADDYQGTSQDLTDPNQPPPLVFFKQDEINHVGALYRSSGISKVEFKIGSPSVWTRLTSDDAGHPDWAIINIYGHRVSVFDGATEYRADGTNTFEFKFKPTIDASQRTDTMWTVVRWVEIH